MKVSGFTEFLMNLTLPSQNPTLTPPGCRLRAEMITWLFGPPWHGGLDRFPFVTAGGRVAVVRALHPVGLRGVRRPVAREVRGVRPPGEPAEVQVGPADADEGLRRHHRIAEPVGDRRE